MDKRYAVPLIFLQSVGVEVEVAGRHKHDSSFDFLGV